MLPSPPVILDPCLQWSPWKQTWQLFGCTRSFQRMHLQQKTKSSRENGVKAKRILKNLQSEKFDKFMYLLLDVMMVCQQGFPRRWFCIADVLVHLEGGISKLEARRCERGARFTDTQIRLKKEIAVLKCGTEKKQELTLTSKQASKLIERVVFNQLYEYLNTG